MREQLAHINALMSHDRVVLQVMPERVGAHQGLDGSFSILYFPDKRDTAIAFVETQAGNIWLEKPKDIHRLASSFRRLEELALDKVHSRTLLEKMMESHESRTS
jgi:hypothetical protein